jgi:uncharacterized integral membrane protein
LDGGPAPRSPSEERIFAPISRAWNGVVPALLVLVLIVVLVIRDFRKARAIFMAASGTSPLAMVLLVAAALGGLFVLVSAPACIVQLRKVIRRNRRANGHGTPDGAG